MKEQWLLLIFSIVSALNAMHDELDDFCHIGNDQQSLVFAERLKNMSIAPAYWDTYNAAAYTLLFDNVNQTPFLSPINHKQLLRVRSSLVFPIVDKWDDVSMLTDNNSVLLARESEDPTGWHSDVKEKVGVSYGHGYVNGLMHKSVEIALDEEDDVEQDTYREPYQKISYPIDELVSSIVVEPAGSWALCATTDGKIAVYRQKKGLGPFYSIMQADNAPDKGSLLALTPINSSLCAVTHDYGVALLEIDETLEPAVVSWFKAPAQGSGYTTKGINYQYYLCDQGLVNRYHSRLYQYPYKFLMASHLTDTHLTYMWLMDTLKKATVHDLVCDRKQLIENALKNMPSDMPEVLKTHYKNIIHQKKSDFKQTASTMSMKTLLFRYR